MATTAPFQRNLSDQTRRTGFTIRRVIGQWNAGGGILSLPEVFITNFLSINVFKRAVVFLKEITTDNVYTNALASTEITELV